MLQRIGIIADDLTGAADALAPFRARGYACELLITPGYPGTSAVTAAITHSRALSAETAREVTDAAATAVIEQGRRPYLKVDSTMRGPVAAQLEGALAACRKAFGESRAVVCPAYPEMGRTVSGGIVSVDGVPLGESVFTADPRNPARLSALGELIPGSVPVDVRDPFWLADGTVGFSDATEPSDLDAIVRAADLDPHLLLAGSAGLTTAWSRTLPPGPASELPYTRPTHTLLVASSRHPVTLEQIRQLPDDLYSVLGEERGGRGIGPLTVLSAPSRFTPHDADRVLDSLARQAEAYLRAEDVQQLILIGGDGAAAALTALGAEAITLCRARMPGHAEGVIRGGVADGMPVITRAGGFGTAATLVELLRLTLDLEERT